MRTHIIDRHAGFTLIEFIIALVVAGVIGSMLYTYFGTALTRSSVPIERLKSALKLQTVMDSIVADYNRLNGINLRYKWKASTPYSVDDVVIPTTNNGHYYTCTAAGTSGGTAPTWPTAANGTVTETGGPTWKEKGNVWQSSLSYTVGTIVVPINNNGHFYKCTVAGTSAATPPTWPTAANGTVTETGGPTWREAGTVLDSSDVTDNLKNYLTNSPGRYDNNSNSYSVVSADTKFIQFSGTTEVDAGTSGTSSEKNYFKVTIRSSDSTETLTQVFAIK